MAIKHPKCDPSSEKKEVKSTPAKKNANNGQKSSCLGSLAQKNTLKWSVMSQGSRSVSIRQCGVEKPLDLEQRIKKKIIELVDKEETLVDLYKKAAEVAKKREKEFRDKSAVLVQQIEKDKNLMQFLKRVN